MNKITKLGNNYQLTTTDGTYYDSLNRWYERSKDTWHIRLTPAQISKTGREYIKQSLVDAAIAEHSFYEFPDKTETFTKPRTTRTTPTDDYTITDYLTPDQQLEYKELMTRLGQLKTIAQEKHRAQLYQQQIAPFNLEQLEAYRAILDARLAELKAGN